MGVQARLNLYCNYNYIGVRSFILTGAPIKSMGGFKFERKHHLTTLERMVRWQEIAYD
jgi:hypothetical protein